jgi:hypothetical protein
LLQEFFYRNFLHKENCFNATEAEQNKKNARNHYHSQQNKADEMKARWSFFKK